MLNRKVYKISNVLTISHFSSPKDKFKFSSFDNTSAITKSTNTLIVSLPFFIDCNSLSTFEAASKASSYSCNLSKHFDNKYQACSKPGRLERTKLS